MKIGVLCPVGPLDRFGYQYHYLTIAENLSRFATQLYLVSTTRNRVHVDKLLTRFANVQYISDENTWLPLDDSDNEVFRLAKLLYALNYGLEKCKQDGMDCMVSIHINQYVPEPAFVPLRKALSDMLDAGRPFEWLYKRYQLGDRLFHADTRVPWILNLQVDNPFLMRADSIHHRNGLERYMLEHGDYRSKDHLAIVDMGTELSVQDLADKQNFVSCYAEMKTGVTPPFDWNTSFPSYVRKYNAKVISDDPLDATGQAIVRDSQSDRLGWLFLKHYRKPNPVKLLVTESLRRLKRRVRRLWGMPTYKRQGL
jgi:hypothetical protein